jgi:hypothetical protein
MQKQLEHMETAGTFGAAMKKHSEQMQSSIDTK